VTQTQAPESDAVSPSDSWADLPESEPETIRVDLPPDKVGNLLTPEPGICQVCGEVIERAPGARGRLPKYHPQCRPTKQAGAAPQRTTRRATAHEAKREYEADLAIDTIQPYVYQLAMGLSLIDQFDSYTILAGWPGVRDNLRGLMIRYDWLRTEVLAISTGGSILGFVLSLLMIGLPIAAHHKIIRGKMIGPMLERAPFMLSKMQERMAEGPDSVKGFLETQLIDKMRTAQQTAAQNGAK
jgi:hypothetical protein